MAWVPIPGALRRWRNYRRMTVPKLVEATRKGVKERTIRLMESKTPQATAEDVTIRTLAKALSDRENGITCHPEFLARWRKADGSFDKFATPDPTLDADATPAVAAAPARESKVAAVPVETKRRKLTANAAVERAIGRDRDEVKMTCGTYALIGLDWVQEIEAQYAEFLGRSFAISGLVTDQRPIPAKAAMRLGTECELGRGAACFKVERSATGCDDGGEEHSITVFPTVFAPKGEHGKQLMRCHRESVEVILRVHLVVSERNGLTGEERWEGFIFFETGKPKPRSWAFVVDAVEEASPPRRARKSRRSDQETGTRQQEIG